MQQSSTPLPLLLSVLLADAATELNSSSSSPSSLKDVA